jgi:hypothetical protein
MQLLKEITLAAILAALLIMTGHSALDAYLSHRHLSMQVQALEREVEHRQRMLDDMAHLLSWSQSRALEVETLFSASELLEFFAADLAAAGATVVVNNGK